MSLSDGGVPEALTELGKSMDVLFEERRALKERVAFLEDANADLLEALTRMRAWMVAHSGAELWMEHERGILTAAHDALTKARVPK